MCRGSQFCIVLVRIWHFPLRHPSSGSPVSDCAKARVSRRNMCTLDHADIILTPSLCIMYTALGFYSTLWCFSALASWTVLDLGAYSLVRRRSSTIGRFNVLKHPKLLANAKHTSRFRRSTPLELLRWGAAYGIIEVCFFLMFGARIEEFFIGGSASTTFRRGITGILGGVRDTV